MPIHMLGSNCFKGPAGRVNEGVSAHSFVGLIQPDGADQFKAYIKLYPQVVGEHYNRSLENEAIGHVVTKACELQVPPEAGFIQLLPEQIPSKPAWVTGPIVAWFTKDVNSLSLANWLGYSNNPDKSIFARQLRAVLKSNIQHSANVAALDAALFNTDRNPGNILQNGTLIDHGNVLTGPFWTEGKLLANKQIENLQNLVIHYLAADADELPFKSARRLYGQNHNANYQKNKASVHKLIHEILYDSQKETARVVQDFIEHRLNAANSAAAIGLIA